jgi:hypothetical protein
LLDFEWKEERRYNECVCQIWSKEGNKNARLEMNDLTVYGPVTGYLFDRRI